MTREQKPSEFIIGGKPMPAWLNRDYTDGFIERFEPASEPLPRSVVFLAISASIIGSMFIGVGMWKLMHWLWG